MRNPETIRKACERTGAEYKGLQHQRRGQTGRRVKVRFPGWSYDCTINCETGECTFDNYGGRWGSEKHLDNLKQGYAVEAAKSKAEAEGHDFETETLSDGSIKCTIAIGGEGGYGVKGGATEGGYGV
jgi:hypothetical protein